ncbi:MAG TPA: hypothetical protein ENI94_13095 [Gammaproteobacteria bacterium]|nr:hypothetical protein [Gammaproteobacteria bacterium]
MMTFRFIPGSIVCASLLVVVSMGKVNAAGDVETVFKDSKSGSAVQLGKISVKRGGVEQRIAGASSLSAALKSCTFSTSQDMDLDETNYRWHDEDVDSAFADPNFAGYKLQSAKLCIKFTDVDFYSATAYTPELDVVQFGSTVLDILRGSDKETREQCWDVKSRLQENAGPNIPFIVNVDAAHSRNYWAVYLHYAKLTTCHVGDLGVKPLPFSIEK